VLFVLEAKFQSHGVLAVAGIGLMVLGALLLVDGPIPQMRVKLVTALSVSIPLGAITVFLMTLALRAHRNKVITGEQGLIGEIGIVQSPLTPKGKVLLRGALWNAVSARNLDVGEKVVVRNIENLVLQVEPLPASQATALNAAKV
jgi:membrane-bound serine protease (ClpP class)